MFNEIPEYKRQELADFFGTLLGHYKHYRNQDEWVYRCPECGKQKFSINFAKGKAHCWTCYHLQYGNLRRIVKDFYPSFLKEFDTIMGNEFVMWEPKKPEPEEAVLLREPYEYSPLYQMDDLLIARPFINYLYGRGVTQKQLKSWNIGFCNNGKYHSRAMFLSYNKKGDVNYFISRAIFPDIDPPYLNATSPKTQIMFNEKNVTWKKPLVLCEGIFDLMAIERYFGDRCDYSLLLGKSLDDSYMLDCLIHYKPKIYLALDNDAIEDTLRIAKFLVERVTDEVWLPMLPDNVKDFGELAKDGAQIVESFKRSERYGIITDIRRRTQNG